MFQKKSQATRSTSVFRRPARSGPFFLAAFAAVYLLAGGAVDFMQASKTEESVQLAANEAASALLEKAGQMSARDLQIAAERRIARGALFFDAPRSNVSAVFIGGVMRVNISTETPTLFLRLIDWARLRIEATGAVRTPRAIVQLA